MTKSQWRKIYNRVIGKDVYRFEIWKEHREYLQAIVEIDNSTVINWFQNKQIEKEMKRFPLAHTEPTPCEVPCAYPCAAYKPTEEKPMAYGYDVKTTATNITIAPAASASAEAAKTDLQTQREYLLGRHREIDRSFDYGHLYHKIRDAYNIDIDNAPKTAQELIDGIKAGTFTADATKLARQNIAIASDSSYDDDDMYTPTRDPLFAMNWGGLQPDRLGYDSARDLFRGQLKASKDSIMIGTPEAGLASLQALEAWTKPVTTTAAAS